MNRNYIILGIVAILGWNAFLIHRDNQMFQKYYNDQAQIEMNSK
jgi:hypothetical protein